MKIVQIFGVLLLFLMSAHGAKVTWGADGKPIIEVSAESHKDGCILSGLDSLSMLSEDENKTVGTTAKKIVSCATGKMDNSVN